MPLRTVNTNLKSFHCSEHHDHRERDRDREREREYRARSRDHSSRHSADKHRRKL